VTITILFVFQSIPRSIVLSRTGQQLVQWPIKEIEKLRSNKVSFDSKELKGGSIFEVSGITASQVTNFILISDSAYYDSRSFVYKFWFFSPIKADVEVSFDLPHLNEAESIDPSWVDPQLLCSQKEASVKGTLGPFGLLVLASNDLSEQTAVFFRIFKRNDNYAVLMCSDQSRLASDSTTFQIFLS